MEGLDALAPGPRPAASVLIKKPAALWYGYLAAAMISMVAFAAHHYYRPLSAAILAVLIGAVLRNFSLVPIHALNGCRRLVKQVLPITIILTGATLNLTDVGRGWPQLLVVMVAITVGTGVAIVAGRLLGASRKTSILVGAGTSICGNSAIISVAPVIRATDEDLLLSISTINILGLVIMVVLPLAGTGLGMSPEIFGVWAGATVHAVPQAIATGLAFGPEGGATATLVKLMRVAMLAPFVLLIGVLARRREGASQEVRYFSLLPPFLWGFTLLALLNTLGLLPEVTFRPLGSSVPIVAATATSLAELGNLLLILSMAAMGMEVNIRQLVRSGGPALVTGLLVSTLQCAATWLAIRLLL